MSGGYYAAEARSVGNEPAAMPEGVTVRAITEADIPALAELYLRCYEHVKTLDDALADMRSEFEGAWGVLWPEASPGAWLGGSLAGAVLSVRRPAWDGVPDCPWLTDVFTDPGHRRSGLARGLVTYACRVMADAGEARVGLTVDDDNLAAVTLYRSLGFHTWPSTA